MVEVVAPSTAWFTPRHSPVARGSILDLSEALSGSGSVYKGQRPPSAAQISVLSLSTSSIKRQDDSRTRRSQESKPQIKKISRFDFLFIRPNSCLTINMNSLKFLNSNLKFNSTYSHWALLGNSYLMKPFKCCLRKGPMPMSC